MDFRRGTPIEGARILMTPCLYEGTTDSLVILFFEEVTPFRNYQVEVDAEGYIHGSAGFASVLPAAVAELVIPLKRTSVLRGQVTARLLGGLIKWPLKNASVKLQQQVDSSFITRGDMQTDVWGRYVFADLDEGEFRVSARAEGFASESADVAIEGGKRIVRNLSLEPQPEASADVARSNGDGLADHYGMGGERSAFV